jgi:hypothetical protein
MLSGRDTFTLAKGRVQVYRSPSSLAELKAAAQLGVPRIAGELLATTNSNRVACPYVFVVVLMNPSDGFPDADGAPFNGGFNLGGGLVVLSSHALDGLPNFQSALQHKLGHAFGLPDVREYGDDMTTSASIMSNNPSHDTRGMRPSPTPGILAAKDLEGLSLNKRAFPKLSFRLPYDVVTGRPLTEVVAFEPLTIDGQPAYSYTVATDSGETFGTKVVNLVQNRISPSQGDRFRSDSMWQSRPSPDGWVSIVVTFPFAVELTEVAIHSQHSGLYNAADGLYLQSIGKNGEFDVIRCRLSAVDARVSLPEPATAKIWRITLHAENNKEVTLRGIQFFNRYGEIFPPS